MKKTKGFDRKRVFFSPLIAVFLSGTFQSSVVCAAEDVAKALPKTPLVLDVQGTVVQISKDGKEFPLKKDEVLRERARIRTGEKSQVSLLLHDESILYLQAQSEIQFPVITWDLGEVKMVELQYGKLRALQKGAFERDYSTPISLDRYPSTDFLLDFSKEKGQVSLTLLRGVAYFRGLQNEEGVHLKQGERGIFAGAIEGGELTYDVLLRGRRVARGTLLPVETLKDSEVNELMEKVKVEKPKPKPPPPKPKRKPGEICEEPFGKLNQCSWVCRGLDRRSKACDMKKAGVSCLRRRCNANGKWADDYIVPKDKSPCGVSPVVGPCDY